jgi:hypothetical protein
MPTSLRRRSSQSLMLSLPSISDPVRVALDAKVRHFSEYVGYANIAVALGVALEGLELVFKVITWSKRRIRKRRERAAHEAASHEFPVGELVYSPEAHSEEPTWLKTLLFIGLLAVVGGIVAEWRYGIKLEDAHNAVHTYDLGKIREADEKAGNAATSATEAETASAKAKTDSASAVASSTNALNIASGARKEADTFDSRIVSATNKATEAESHLADALHETAQAQQELNRLKTPRSLNNPLALISSLKRFSGSEYEFVGVFSDEDSTTLLKEMDTALQLAGWKRLPSPLKGGLAVTIDGNFQVPPDVRTGVKVEVESTEKLETLKQTPMGAMPQHIQAASALKWGLYLSIGPIQTDLGSSLGVNQGSSTVVAILVGKKP